MFKSPNGSDGHRSAVGREADIYLPRTLDFLLNFVYFKKSAFHADKEKNMRFWIPFLYLEALSVLLGVLAALLLAGVAPILWSWLAVPLGKLDLGPAHAVGAALLFVVMTTASVVAAAVAKLTDTAPLPGVASYQWLNDHVHKRCVVVMHSVFFIGLAVGTYQAQDWVALGLLVAAVVAYMVVTVRWKIQPHSFWARYRSVLVVRLPLALCLAFMILPRWPGILMIGVGIFMIVSAYEWLRRDQRKYDWPDR